jgi:hypothetical protein
VEWLFILFKNIIPSSAEAPTRQQQIETDDECAANLFNQIKSKKNKIFPSSIAFCPYAFFCNQTKKIGFFAIAIKNCPAKPSAKTNKSLHYFDRETDPVSQCKSF